MMKIVTSLTLSMLLAFGVYAQTKGDWYVGTGDIANKAWTEWSIAPTVGYGLTDKVMVGINISQADSTVDISYDLYARYYLNNFFVYVSTTGLDTDNMRYGVGKMFTLHKGVYLDPKVVYDATAKKTNLMLGVGLKF